MTVVDTSALVDFLLADGVASEVEALLVRDGPLAAPDVLVFETLAVLRRDAERGTLPRERAQAAINDLGDLAVDLFPTLPLRQRTWELRENITVADALFVSLAERLDEPFATKDRGLAAAVATHVGIELIELIEPGS